MARWLDGWEEEEDKCDGRSNERESMGGLEREGDRALRRRFQASTYVCEEKEGVSREVALITVTLADSHRCSITTQNYKTAVADVAQTKLAVRKERGQKKILLGTRVQICYKLHILATEGLEACGYFQYTSTVEKHMHRKHARCDACSR